MKYTEFVKGYKNAKEKEQWVGKIIKTTYLSYATKESEAKQIASLSSHIMNADGSEGAYKRNTASQYFLTQLRILINYTNLDIENNNVMDAYDALSECGALDVILAQIPEKELTMFTSMVQMAMDDVYINEADVGAVLSTKLEAFRLMADTAMSALEEVAKNNMVENK